MFDFELNKRLNSLKMASAQSTTSLGEEADKVATLNGSLDTSRMVNLNDTFAPLSPPSPAGNSGNNNVPFTFKRGYSLDSSMLQSVHLQQASPPKSSYDESDICKKLFCYILTHFVTFATFV